jgi:spermidine/putrescine transport system ATP-binding protein
MIRSITIEKVSKSFAGEQILHNVNLHIPSGSFFALLGPSGSGKTTLLRLIAGLEQPDNGKIFLGEDNITQLQAHERKVNTVFQNYALFPHMNVFDNVAYSLMIKGIHKEIIAEKVINVISKVGLDRYLYKSIQSLSGGQQQRVALARAVINEPDVLLFDEPLSALDLKLREQMLLELVALQDELGTTFVYVTHDQSEALTVADDMAIMNNNGKIEQVGKPQRIYEYPQTVFVAEFVGTTNLLHGILKMDNDNTFVYVKNLGNCRAILPKKHSFVHEQTIVMSIRPEKIEISKEVCEGFSNFARGTVESMVYLGRSTQYNVLVGKELMIKVFEQNEEHFPTARITYDDEVYLYWQADNVVLLESK